MSALAGHGNGSARPGEYAAAVSHRSLAVIEETSQTPSVFAYSGGAPAQIPVRRASVRIILEL